jgi:hypothetical protein
MWCEIAGEDQNQGNETRQKKKLVVTEEEFQRITHALVMRLRQHEEEVMHDGISKLCYSIATVVVACKLNILLASSHAPLNNQTMQQVVDWLG